MNSIDDEKCVYLQCTSVCAPKFFDDIVVVGAGDKCLSSNIALLFNHSLGPCKGPSPLKNPREDHATLRVHSIWRYNEHSYGEPLVKFLDILTNH